MLKIVFVMEVVLNNVRLFIVLFVFMFFLFREWWKVIWLLFIKVIDNLGMERDCIWFFINVLSLVVVIFLLYSDRKVVLFGFVVVCFYVLNCFLRRDIVCCFFFLIL